MGAVSVAARVVSSEAVSATAATSPTTRASVLVVSALSLMLAVSATARVVAPAM